VTQQYSSEPDNEGSNVPKRPEFNATFTGCDVDGVPISGTFATNDQVAASFADSDIEGVSMANAVRAVLSEVTDFAVEPKAHLAGPVTLMSGTTGTFTIADYEGVEYEVFVRTRPV